VLGVRDERVDGVASDVDGRQTHSQRI
jgi:hypothetical protein